MSWFLFVLSFFQCVSPFLKVKMNDQKKTSKFRETSSINKNTSANSGPQRLVEDSRVLQLQREAIHDPWSPSRVGRLVRKWGKYYNQLQTTHCCWWLLLHLKDADLWHPCPKNCTCLLFSSVFFMFFTHIISHPNAMEFGWDRGPRFTIYMKMYMAYVCTCTDHKVETCVQSHPIL